MKYKFIKLLSLIILLFGVVSFSGCESKKINYNLNKNIETNDTESEFDNEFNDEFEEKNNLNNECQSLYGYNNTMTNFNDLAMTNVLKPISNGYKYIAPRPVRQSIGNFFVNLAFPFRFLNNVLQFKLVNATEEIGVFLINSTIGIFGLFQPAQHFLNLKIHNEDFGQTLGHYGISGGCHIVLPFLGPSNVRDIIGLSLNIAYDPVYNYDYDSISKTQLNTARALEQINALPSRIQKYEILTQDAIELYPYLRDSYEQFRQKEIEK